MKISAPFCGSCGEKMWLITEFIEHASIWPQNRTHRSEDDFVQVEILCVRNLVVVRLLQSRDVSVTCGDRVSQRDNAATPSGARQPRANTEILGNVDQLVKILVAALVKRLQAVMRLHHQLRQLVDGVLLVVIIVSDLAELLNPDRFCKVSKRCL